MFAGAATSAAPLAAGFRGVPRCPRTEREREYWKDRRVEVGRGFPREAREKILSTFLTSTLSCLLARSWSHRAVGNLDSKGPSRRRSAFGRSRRHGGARP